MICVAKWGGRRWSKCQTPDSFIADAAFDPGEEGCARLTDGVTRATTLVDDVAAHTRGVTQRAAQAKTLCRGASTLQMGHCQVQGMGGPAVSADKSRVHRRLNAQCTGPRVLSPMGRPSGFVVRSTGLGALALFETLNLLQICEHRGSRCNISRVRVGARARSTQPASSRHN